MATYAMLTRLSPDAIPNPSTIELLGQQVIDKLNADCPEAKWIASYAVLGPCDYLDLFEAPDNETAAKVSTLIRTDGRSHSEVWAATEWAKFKAMVHAMPA